MRVYAVVKENIEHFGKPLLVENIIAVKATLIEAQQEHAIFCNAANDCKAYAIRGPYPANDETIKAFILRLTSIKQFNELNIVEMKAEGFGVFDITQSQLESDKLFVNFQCKGGAK